MYYIDNSDAALLMGENTLFFYSYLNGSKNR